MSVANRSDRFAKIKLDNNNLSPTVTSVTGKNLIHPVLSVCTIRYLKTFLFVNV